LVAFPNPDEAYYWLWGQHFDWSYYDHPPLLAWIQGTVAAVLGRSRFALRLPNLATTALFLYTQFRICRYLYGDRIKSAFGILMAVILASPLFFIFLGLAWNDHLLITASLIGGYQFVKFIDGYRRDGRGNSAQLYTAALTLGIAGLAKYNALFVAFALLLVVVSDRSLRPLLGDRRFYGAIALGILCFVPVLVWNITNDFQSFGYYTSRSVNGGAVGLQIKPFEPVGFWLFSALLLSPWLVEIIGRILRGDRSVIAIQTETIYPRVALWVFGVPTVGLSAIALFSTAYYYWNIMAYGLLFPLMLGPLLHWHQAAPAQLRRKRWFWGQQIYGLVLITLIMVHYTLLPLSALVSDDPNADPDSRMLFGWNRVAPVVLSEQRRHISSSPQGLFLATTDYRSAAALAYQLDNPEIYALSERQDQFDIWLGQRDLGGQDALLLYDQWHPLTPLHRQHFEQIDDSAIAIPIKRFGIVIKTYFLTKARSFSP
ncbi:MAG: glycosyltransferase family 39 protein, partial [Cyanobacteria bacterium P01_H01_bin.119]